MDPPAVGHMRHLLSALRVCLDQLEAVIRDVEKTAVNNGQCSVGTCSAFYSVTKHYYSIDTGRRLFCTREVFVVMDAAAYSIYMFVY